MNGRFARNSVRSYTRHSVARLELGSFYDRFMGWLMWINRTLPIINPRCLPKTMWVRGHSGGGLGHVGAGEEGECGG